jgi:hypothetical protein
MDQEYGLQFRHEDDEGWQWVVENGLNFRSKSRSTIENEKTFRESLTRNLVYRVVERDVSDWRASSGASN